MSSPNYHLISTSTMFLVPAIYGYCNSLYSLSTVSLLTTLCSINFWRNPVGNDWRLSLDKTMATTSGIIYFLYGYNNIKNPSIKMLGYWNAGSIVGFYALAQILHSHNSPYWLYSHMIFHCFTTVGKILVLHNSLTTI
jgi:hypothetical protein